jgi:PPM family protein phosphatase
MGPRTASLVVPSRTRSDDAADVIEVDDRLVLVLVDGAGGSGSGAAAARAVISSVHQLTHDLTTGALAPAALLAQIDRDLARAPTGGQTTVIVALASEGSITGASVGDSEAWLFTDRAVLDLTRDQHRKPLLGTGQAVPVPFETSAAGKVV